MALRNPISVTKAFDRGSRFGDVNVPLKLQHYSITLLPVFVAKAPDLLKPFSGAKSSVSLEPGPRHFILICEALLISCGSRGVAVLSIMSGVLNVR